MEHTNTLKIINKYLLNYLVYVAEKEDMENFNFTYTDDDDESCDKFRDEFCFTAVNNYDKGYSFISYLREINVYEKIKHKLSNDFMFYIIKMINRFYEIEYGIECIMDYKKLSFDYILHHYAYYFVHNDIDNTRYEIDRKMGLITGDYNESDENTYTDSESDEDCDECCGKYCENKENLKKGFGIENCYDITESLYCDECYEIECFNNCNACCNKYNLEKLQFVKGVGFGKEFKLYCDDCIKSIRGIISNGIYNQDEYE